jgi:hypothetical protein
MDTYNIINKIKDDRGIYMKEIFKNLDNQSYEDGVILAVSNSYEKLYYFNDDFDQIPEAVQKELQVLMVMHTEELGGIIAVGFDKEGHLYIEVTATEYDGFYDEIGSNLKVKEYQREYKNLFASLEEFYDCFF